MAQEIKRRLFSSRKVIATLLALVVIGAALLALTVFAESDKITLSISDATGYEGETVWVEVNISGTSNLVQLGLVDKVAGGQFRIPYDAAVADVKSDRHITLGPLISDPYSFITAMNNKHDGDVVSVAWAGRAMNPNDPEYDPDIGYHRDGQLWKIKFTLEGPGTVDLTMPMEYIAFYTDDMDGNLVEIPKENIQVVPGKITVKSRQLAQAAPPTWHGDMIKWDNVENASRYEVCLYRGGELVDTQTVAQGVNSYDFSAKIAQLTPGIFTVTIQAKADAPWRDGPVSEPSAANTKTVTLGRVARPTWDGWAITWADVDGAAEYEVKLYLYDALVKTVTVNPGVCRYDFNNDTAAAGSYTATVQAKGDGALYLDGPVSEKSSPQIRAIKLAQVGQPTWSEPGVISWGVVESAAAYRVELLKDGASIAVVTTAEQSYNFLAAMHSGGAGSYTVRVTALAPAGDPYIADGDPSAPSAAQEVIKLAQVGKPSLSDQGVATWGSVPNAAGYKVHLYKGATLVSGQTTAADVFSYDFLGIMRSEGAGSYTVRVTAIGTGLYLSGDESEPSAAQVVAVLPAPANLAWQSDTVPLLRWENVSGADGYKVQLYKGGTAVGEPVFAADGEVGYDFTDLIGDAAGYYNAKVKALGSGLYLDSPYSVASGLFTKTGSLGQVTQLNLSDKGVLTWIDEPDADNFELQLYRSGGTAVGEPRTVARGVQRADFREAMRGAGEGSYYVTVVAKGSGLFTDGPPANSNSQQVSKLSVPAVISFSERGVSSWSSVEHATHYDVRLCLPEGHPRGSFKTYSTEGTSLDHLSIMREFPGTYSVYVQARDLVGLYLDGDEVESEARTVIKLAQVSRPVLSSDGNATWVDVPNATGYKVSLYKGTALVKTETVAPNVQTCTFLNEIKSGGSGSYTVTVTALGDAYLILDGDPSPRSEAVTARVLPKARQPVWAIESGTVTLGWDQVEGASCYRVIVHNGTTEDQVTYDEVTETSLAFAPHQPGFYWATVQPLGAGITFDGAVSDLSAVLVSFKGASHPASQNGGGSYTAEGRLPVSGYLWMRITSATGNDGVMRLEQSATSGYPAPEGLTAAGIFFHIELDENLSGSHVLLKAGYDPAALPERMDQASLRFYRYDTEKGWTLLKSEADPAEEIVSAEIAEFSTIGIFGEISEPPVELLEDEKPKDDLPRTFGYVSYLLLIGLLLATAGIFLFNRRQQLENR